MTLIKHKIFGREYREAKIELENYWLSSHKGGEKKLACNIKELRNTMRINFFFEDNVTFSGAVHHANTLMEKWWYEE